MTSKSDVLGYIARDVAVTYRHDRGYELRQRARDFVFASIVLAATSPVIALAAFAIWLEDGASPIFTQKRVGQFGRLFTIYKLRTMRVADCVDALSPSSGTDSRITRLGSILRKTSIDELPQLVNVVRGEMAIVGPRPEMPFVVARYEPWQHCRHLRKPGVTGLWQISVRKQIPMHRPEATKIDLEYVRTASTSTDWRIILRTFTAIFSTQGAY
jgi:lipopolysaccharide/colanic/teichoic acid biosynthesis glycosyltransferase